MIDFLKSRLRNSYVERISSSGTNLRLPIYLFIIPVISSFILIFIQDFSIQSFDFYWQYAINLIPLLIDIISISFLIVRIPELSSYIFSKISKKKGNMGIKRHKIFSRPIEVQMMFSVLPFTLLFCYALGLFVGLLPVIGIKILSFIMHLGSFAIFLSFKNFTTINLGYIRKPSKISVLSLVLIPLGFGISFAEIEVLNLIYYILILLVIVLVLILRNLNKTDYYIILMTIILSLSVLRIFYGSVLTGRTDVHNEIYVANLTIKNNGWLYNATTNTYNSVFSVTVLPFLVFRIFSISPILYFGFIDPLLSTFFIVFTFRLVTKISENREGNLLKEKSLKLIFILILVAGIIQTGTHQIFSNNRSLMAFSLFVILVDRTFPDLIKKESLDTKENYWKYFGYQLVVWLCIILSHWGTAIVGFLYFVIYYIVVLVRLSKRNKKILLYILLIMTLIIVFGVTWYSYSPIIRELVYRIFQGFIDFLKNPSFDALIKNNILLQNLLFLNSTSNAYDFFVSLLYLISIALPILSIIISSIHYFRNSSNSKISKHELKILLLITLTYYLTNGFLLLIPYAQELYGSNRSFYQGLFFFTYICYYGFSIIEGLNFRIWKKKKIKFSSVKILSILLVITFIFHQGILLKFIHPFTQSDNNYWDGNLLFDKHSIDFSRWYTSKKDIAAFQWIRNNKISEYVFSDVTRLYQVYTYSGIDYNTDKLYNSNIKILLDSKNLENLPIGFIVYIPNSVVLCDRMYFSDIKTDYLELNLIIQKMELLNLSVVFDDGAILYQQL